MSQRQSASVETFACWLERQGRRVVRTESSCWHSEGVRALQAFPYHWTIEPGERELVELLWKQRAVCLRYSAPICSPLGCVSYHVVREGPGYDLQSLGKWARKNVRRGLRNCCVEAISFDRLAEEGWALQCDTLKRQQRRLRVTAEDWRVRCLAAKDLPGFEAWAAMVSRRLAASVITFRMDDCVYLLSQQCHHEFLTAHVNNSLSFRVTQEMLRRSGVRSVFYSLHSLDASASMDEFKFRMGYAARVVRQRVLFHPVLERLANPSVHALVRAARVLIPGHPVLAKAEGLLRFRLQGKRPLSQQDYPASLVRQLADPSEAEELADQTT
jgi:hypothetical protein